MFFFSVLLLLAACLSPTYQQNDAYCKIHREHTMCKYKGLGRNCQNPGSYGVSENDKRLILSLHNNLRRRVAKGLEKRGYGGPQPRAANLRTLVWDNELATIAQRWADQCIFNHDVRDVNQGLNPCGSFIVSNSGEAQYSGLSIHCTVLKGRWKVGQNIYWMSQIPVGKVNWTAAIYSWYDEVALFNPREVSRYNFDSRTGHYTQMLWHSTYTIGCGRRDYGPNKIYVCNYGPSGNWQGLPMYEVGAACSKCPERHACVNYLCGVPTQNKTTPGKPKAKPLIEFVKEFVSEDKIKENPNAPKIYLAVFYKKQVYLKPLSVLDSLYDTKHLIPISSEALIDENKEKYNDEELKILGEIINKYRKVNETDKNRTNK